MTARWGELRQSVVFEVRAFKEGAQPQTAKFAPDWIDDAVDWIVSLNELGFNIYAVRNPIDAKITGSASDKDIVASFFLWADCDDPQAAGNVYRFDGPKWTSAVTTGTVPSIRVHTYWMLNEPCTDMAEWRSCQEAIAAHFGSDSTVVNPSRIMRVGGTVSYPAKRKQERGYQKELSVFRNEYDDARLPVTLDQMRRVFASSAAPATTPDRVHIETGVEHGRSTSEYIEILKRAQTDGEKHGGVRDLAASLAGQGVKRAMAEAIIRAVCPVWDSNVEDLIETAYRKFYNAEPEPIKATPEVIADFKIDSSADFLADLEPLEYLIDGLLPKGVAYSLTGYPGHGKTTLALQFALSIAQGEDFAERKTSKGSVLFLAGENPYNVKWQYAAALAAQNLRSNNADIHFVQGRFSIKEWSEVLRAKISAMPNLKLIIVDSLQAFFEGDNDNDNTQMVEMAHKFRALCETPQRPSILVIAHPAGKTPNKDTLVPRGGGAFLAEIDGNLTVWSNDASQQTLHHSQKFRGAGFDPIEWVMQVHEFEHLTDVNGTPLRLPVSRPEMAVERMNREQRSDRLLRQYLETVMNEQPVSEREGATRFGVTRYRMTATIQTAKDEKLIKRHAKTWKITDGGRDFLNG